jgi:hypothetical protein
MVLPNDIHFSKYWLVKAFGVDIADSIMDFSNKFLSLKLTPREISFMYPVILTFDGLILILNFILTYKLYNEILF